MELALTFWNRTSKMIADRVYGRLAQAEGFIAQDLRSQAGSP